MIKEMLLGCRDSSKFIWRFVSDPDCRLPRCLCAD